jgi:hypothetical protein
MGTVWAGVHRAEGVPVAVKLLSREHAESAHFRALFRNELRHVAALSHPGIVLVLDFGELGADAGERSGGILAPGTPWLAMEYASEGSLDRGPMADWAAVKDALLAVLAALAHAHARGVLHRDIKPANLLCCGPGDMRPGLKLADFGVAHALRDAGSGGRRRRDTPVHGARAGRGALPRLRPVDGPLRGGLPRLGALHGATAVRRLLPRVGHGGPAAAGPRAPGAAAGGPPGLSAVGGQAPAEGSTASLGLRPRRRGRARRHPRVARLGAAPTTALDRRAHAAAGGARCARVGRARARPGAPDVVRRRVRRAPRPAGRGRALAVRPAGHAVRRADPRAGVPVVRAARGQRRGHAAGGAAPRSDGRGPHATGLVAGGARPGDRGRRRPGLHPRCGSRLRGRPRGHGGAPSRRGGPGGGGARPAGGRPRARLGRRRCLRRRRAGAPGQRRPRPGQAPCARRAPRHGARPAPPRRPRPRRGPGDG